MRRQKLNGYWCIKVGLDYPGTFSRGSSGGGWILEHRYVMEQHIGRSLTPEEVVHHINFDRSDNRIENLALLPNNSEHRRLHLILKGHGMTSSVCATCGKVFEISKGTLQARQLRSDGNVKLHCSKSCHIKAQRKVERPSKEELSKLVWEKPIHLIAKDFGVSVTAIEKWCKRYEIHQKPSRGYWSKKSSMI